MKLPSNTTARAVEEWIGKTPDSAIPAHVKARVFERFGGKCAITGKKLHAGEYDIDHTIELRDGGENRESNLRPVWTDAHKRKSAASKSIRAKVDRIKRKQLPRPKSKIPSRGFGAWHDNTKYINQEDFT